MIRRTRALHDPVLICRPPAELLENCIQGHIRYYEQAYQMIRQCGFDPESVGCRTADEIIKGKIKYFKG